MANSMWVEMDIGEERSYPNVYGDMDEIITVGPGKVRVPLQVAIAWGWQPEPEPEPELEELDS